MKRVYCFLVAFIFFFACTIVSANEGITIPILCYHNFNPTIPGSMTITPHRFEEQLNWLKQNGYTVIPLSQAVNYLKGKINSIPTKSVVITDDDGRATVYRYLLPIAQKYHIPVTLFIYPMIISKAHYALTWQQLKALQQTGLFTVEDHTYWHPNFKQEKKHLSEVAYEKLVHTQLVTSKKILEEKLGTPVTLLAWPFGIHNAYLEQQAAKAGYVMAFSIAARHATRFDDDMAQPRYMIIQDQNMKMFASIIKGYAQGKRRTI